MDSRAFELLISKINDQKADHKEAMAEVRVEMAEIKKLVQENRDFRIRFGAAALTVQFILGLIWHYMENINR